MRHPYILSRLETLLKSSIKNSQVKALYVIAGSYKQLLLFAVPSWSVSVGLSNRLHSGIATLHSVLLAMTYRQ